MNRHSATKRRPTKAARGERTRKASSRKASARKATARVARKPEPKKDIKISGLAIAQVSASSAGGGEANVSAVAQIGSAMRAHKFRVGQTVFYTSSPITRPGANGSYKVVRLLPSDGEDYQYRIKHAGEAFERVAKESQLELES